jgi:hypothetical protein
MKRYVSACANLHRRGGWRHAGRRLRKTCRRFQSTSIGIGDSWRAKSVIWGRGPEQFWKAHPASRQSRRLWAMTAVTRPHYTVPVPCPDLTSACRTPPKPSRRFIGPGMPNISPHRQPILVPSLVVASFTTRKSLTTGRALYGRAPAILDHLS